MGLSVQVCPVGLLVSDIVKLVESVVEPSVVVLRINK